MTYLSETMRVELSLPPALLRVFVMGGVKREDKYFAPLTDLLFEAVHAPLADLSLPQQAKIQRRVKRVVDPIVAEHNNEDGLKVLLMTLVWTDHLTESDALHMLEGSPFIQAYDLLREMFGDDAGRWAAVKKSAEKQARRLHETIQKMGYFR